MSNTGTAIGIDVIMTNCIAYNNREDGISSNDNSSNNTRSQNMILYNNIAYHNGHDPTYTKNRFGFNFYNPTASDGIRYLKNNISYDNLKNNQFLGPISHENNSWDISGLTIQPSDFLSLDSTGIKGARLSDGSLPVLDFLKLSSTSQAIDKGQDTISLSEGIIIVGFSGDAPDIGYYEFDDYEAEPSVPAISTRYPSLLTTTDIYTGGYMITDGGGTISAKGVCYNTTGSPTTADSKISGGSGTADFNITLMGLSAEMTYYIRAYATNETGTGYGSTYSITTDEWNWVKHGTKINTHLGKTVIVR
jgi:hypothetical protein